MERENQRVAVTKRMLQDGLLRLLENKDLDKVKITELCAEAGINRVTFYRHYQTPGDVLLEIEREIVRELRHQFQKPQTLQELKHYLEDVCGYMDEHITLIKILVRNNTDSDFYHVFNGLFQQIVKNGTLDNVVGNVDTDAMNILSMFNAGGFNFLMRQWLLGNLQKSAKEIANLFYELICAINWDELAQISSDSSE